MELAFIVLVFAVFIAYQAYDDYKKDKQKNNQSSKPDWFDEKVYLENNPDVSEHGLPAWQHYVDYGKVEKRPPYFGVDGIPSGDQVSDYKDVIIKAAKKYNPSNKLNYLVFGGINSLAEALRKDPSIAPNLRVFFIGSVNRSKASPLGWDYISRNFRGSLELYRDEAYKRPFYSGGDQNLIRDLERAVKAHPNTGNVWNSYPLEYEKGARRTQMKAGDYPTYLYLTRPSLKDKVFIHDGGKFYVSRRDDTLLRGDTLRKSVLDEMRGNLGGWSSTDGTQGSKGLIIDTDISIRGSSSDKDDQQALILLRGAFAQFKIEAFIATNPKTDKGKVALDQLWDELPLSAHLKSISYQGSTGYFSQIGDQRPAHNKDSFSPDKVIYSYNGVRALDFPVTSKITKFDVGDTVMRYSHSEEGEWLPNTLEDGKTQVNANLHVIFKDGDKWVSFPFEHSRWPEQNRKDLGFKNLITKFDHSRYAPDNRTGDDVGFYISTQTRYGSSPSGNRRTNIVWRKVA